MDALPKNANGKTLRINIAERTGLGNVDEESSQLTRLFEAKCPEINTPLRTAIPISSVDFESSVQQLLLSADSRVTKVIIVTVDLPGKQDTVAAFVELPGIENEATSERNTLASRMKKLCEEQLHQYCTPKLVHVMKPSVTSLPTLRKRAFQLLNAIDAVSLPQNQLEKDVEIIWRNFFSLPTTISTDLSFFELGGDSLKAGQLMTKMRKTFQVDLNVSDLLSAPTIEAIASKIDGLKRVDEFLDLSSTQPSTRKSIVLDLLGMDVVNQDLDCKYKSADCVSPFSSSSLSCMFVQSLPLVLFGPSLYITKWFLWAFYWTLMERINVCGDRLLSLILACVMMRITVAIVAPFVAIALKWIIMGRFKPGRYQLWGAMYLRWWIVSQISMICGKGIFSMDPRLLCLYYRMLGASIGSNVKIHGDAKLGEWDLIHIGDDVCIDAAIVRPFTLDEGHFIQLPIKIGSYCSVGAKSVVIPGTDMPELTDLGPLSSTYEMRDAKPKYRQYCRTSFEKPPVALVFFGTIVLSLVNIICRIPWLVCLHFMVEVAKKDGEFHADITSIQDTFWWCICPDRLIFFFLLRIIDRCFVPFIRLGLAIFFKWTIIGKFTPMDIEQKKRAWNQFRYWLMERLWSKGHMRDVSKLVGTHYGIVSLIFRAFGSKVGKYVYWPGSGLEIVEYDLLDVGDCVTFGSRSVVMTSTVIRSDNITFESGSMIADRCVVLPGTKMCQGSILGSGGLAAEDFIAPTGSVWVGSSQGSAVNIAPADNSFTSALSPFAKAFYLRHSNYCVLSQSMIVVYNTLWQAICVCYNRSVIPLALISMNFLVGFDQVNVSLLLGCVFLLAIGIQLALSLLALSVVVATKWIIIGQRKPGVFSWDESSYCQRWQMHLTICEILLNGAFSILDNLRGSYWLVLFFRALGCTIGRDVCLYPTGGDPMMTEPDLVTIGDCASIDNASLIAHINTRGVWMLRHLNVGS